jgi:hypothetical protein
MDRVGFIDKKEVERLKQEPEEHRRRIFRRLQGVITLLMFATVLIFAYCCRAELQFLFFSKPATQIDASSSAGSNSAQDNSTAHEAAVNEVTK